LLRGKTPGFVIRVRGSYSIERERRAAANEGRRCMGPLGWSGFCPGSAAYASVPWRLAATLNVKDLADARCVRMLDESGFIDRVKK
jgi:hypothetical protein